MARAHLVAERFHFEEAADQLLGRGGMGEVYRGHDRFEDQPVAIKVLREDRFSAQSNHLERFAREGQILRELAHPNIVCLLANERDDDGRQLLVMEYVAGGSLRALLDARLLSVREVLRLALELADALTRVHHLGVVHRDIKPDNVLLTEAGTPKLTDFGIAHLGAESRLTAEGAVVGTLSYLSPEACSGEVLDARSDVWSFGVMVYEMLTGQRPFRGDTALAVVAAITSSELPALVRPDGEPIPEALSALVGAMLVKDRGARLARMRQIGLELETLLDQLDEDQSPSTSELERRVTEPARDRSGALAKTATLAEELGVGPTAVGEGATELPTAPRPSAERIVLDKVRRHWIAGVLERSLESVSYIPTSARRCDERVERPWDDSGSRVPSGEEQLGLDNDVALLELYDGVDRALLVLGMPGSGKTTVLLRLTRALLRRANADAEAPIPVVLNLSTWTARTGSLAEWIREELIVKYQIPRELSRSWLAEQRLTLILDELDGVHSRDRRDCVAAINEFRRAHGLLGIVVGSRSDDYDNLGARLRVGGAVDLLAPSDEHLDALLASTSGAKELRRLAAALDASPKLRELARSPLMLGLMRELYAGEGGASGSPEIGDSSDEHMREEVLRRYVSWALRERAQLSIAPERLRDQLIALARSMSDHDQRVFMIEAMQPSWLPSRALRWLFFILTRLVLVLVLSWVLLVSSHLVRDLGGPLAIFLPVEGARLLGLHGFVGECAVSLSISLAAIAGALVLEIPIYAGAFADGEPRLPSQWVTLGLRVAAAFVVTGTLIYVGMGDMLQAAFWAANTSAGLAMLSYRRTPPSFATEIEPVEAIGWSWRQAWPGASVGLLFSIPGLLSVIDESWHWIIYQMWAIPLFFFLVAGLRARRLEAHSVPNQGVRSSLRNAALAGALVTLAEGLMHLVWWGVLEAKDVMLSLVVITPMMFGLFAALEHGLVRALLAATGRLPLRLQPLLDEAVTRGLMRQVGGGYMFIHPLVQEHLTAQAAPSSTRGSKACASLR